MSAYGADWSGFKQLKVDAQKKGDSFTLVLPANDGRYDVDVYFTKGPLYGNVDVLPAGAQGDEFQRVQRDDHPRGKNFFEEHYIPFTEKLRCDLSSAARTRVRQDMQLVSTPLPCTRTARSYRHGTFADRFPIRETPYTDGSALILSIPLRRKLI